MLFLLNCCTPMKNKGVSMSVFHSAGLCGFGVNSEQPKVQRDPTA